MIAKNEDEIANYIFNDNSNQFDEVINQYLNRLTGSKLIKVQNELIKIIKEKQMVTVDGSEIPILMCGVAKIAQPFFNYIVKAVPNQVNQTVNQRTPLQYALKNRQFAIVDILIRGGGVVSPKDALTAELIEALKDQMNNEEKIKDILESILTIFQRNPDELYEIFNEINKGGQFVKLTGYLLKNLSYSILYKNDSISGLILEALPSRSEFELTWLLLSLSI